MCTCVYVHEPHPVDDVAAARSASVSLVVPRLRTAPRVPIVRAATELHVASRALHNFLWRFSRGKCDGNSLASLANFSRIVSDLQVLISTQRPKNVSSFFRQAQHAGHRHRCRCGHVVELWLAALAAGAVSALQLANLLRLPDQGHQGRRQSDLVHCAVSVRHSDCDSGKSRLQAELLKFFTNRKSTLYN